ncbi:DUF4011 domain-containing anti-phage protein Hhe [Chitinilyticum litopenaei]|uniref:DUF4011 domain-containing anti-phage protein Hhe n=1 Tax=Chitinilyticum litopenaei TaxID=1121276 RepID=UPI000412437A|nr:DUF4011 domain-containing anti-phage protein Hhe [Chitinilyticum litopenaei]
MADTLHTSSKLKGWLLELVPKDGSSIGNKTLYAALKKQADVFTVPCEEFDYWQIRDEMIASGVLATGRGRGGSVMRVDVGQPSIAQTEAEADEVNDAESADDDAEQSNKIAVPPNLEKLRNRLLDLGARNRLLNFSHGRGKRYVRVVDEQPDQLFSALLNDKSMRFAAVPEPTKAELIDAGYLKDAPEGESQAKRLPSAEEWARYLAFNTSFDLPEAGDFKPGMHDDMSIQTLYFAPELESRLKLLYGESRLALEESGANVLYLALGFLEWDESVAGKNSTRLAPLVLLPVRLEKDELNAETSTYDYRISYTGEEILTNLSLKEKLRIDFGIALPVIRPDTQPDAYFKEVQQTVLKVKDGWKLRRFASLGLFEFSKLMMYLDLDPNRWSGVSLVDHVLVQQLTGTRGIADSGSATSAFSAGYAGEYQIDQLDNVENSYPLIDDADSSQHSAIIDVLDGQSLVIEGPPGTGKSQTITNIIAAAIAAGKTILFVAEKNAALSVVAGRLSRAGLGNFCLEMHSHKSQKLAIINSIRERINKRGTYKAPAVLDAQIAQLHQHRTKLNDYVAQLHEPYRDTGLNHHQVLNRARRYRDTLPVSVEQFHPMNIEGVSESQVEQEARFFSRFFNSAAAFDGGAHPISSHPWFGLLNERLDGQQRSSLILRLKAARQAIADVANAAKGFASSTPIPNLASWSLDDITTLCKGLESLQQSHGDEDWAHLRKLDMGGCELLVNWLNRVEANLNEQERLRAQVHPDFISDASRLDELEQALVTVRKHTEQADLKLVEMANLLRVMNDLLADSPALQLRISRIRKYLPTERADVLNTSEEGLATLVLMIEMARALPTALMNMRNALFASELLDSLLPALEKDLTKIRLAKMETAKHLYTDRLPSADELEDLGRVLDNQSIFRWLNGQWRAARKSLLGLARPGVKFAEALTALYRAEEFQRQHHNVVVDGAQYKRALGQHFQGLDTDLESLQALRRWYRTIRECCGTGFSANAWVADWIANAPNDVLTFLGNELSAVDVLLNQVREVARATEKTLPFNARNIRGYDLLAPDGVFTEIIKSLTPALKVFSQSLRVENPSVSDVAQLSRDIRVAQESYNRLIRDESLRQRLGILALPDARDATSRSVLTSWRHTVEFLTPLLELPDPEPWLERALGLSSAEANALLTCWQKAATSMVAAIEAWQAAWQQFQAEIVLNEAFWWSSAGQLTPETIAARINAALEREDLLEHWLEYRRLRSRLEKLGFQAVIQAMEEGDLGAEYCVAASLGGLLDLWAKDLLSQRPLLAQFSGKEQEAIRSRFAEIDHELKRLQRERFAWQLDQRPVPLGVNSGRVKERTELALLEHEVSKQRRHEPLRTLMLRSGAALQALKPCFMMSPMAVAQYLPAGRINFDIVIMDEASQVRSEEALGSFARGRQVVVVGDPKQLPPTSFFSRQGGDDEMVSDETSVAEVAESILDAAMPLFKFRRLRWHYRSRHESLISFSNTAFYDGDLVVYPSPHNESNEFGIKLVKVPRGCFFEQRNIEEAEIIARAIEHHLLTLPHESLGVVAMNVKQTEQIERMLDERSKDNPALRNALEACRGKDEPLFIKNLENVQGDERDVIFISFTYGPVVAGGKVPQRFGPVNSDGGWRRLNVLFTRSKKRMHVFTSFGSADVVCTGTSNRGVVALRDFLAYAETGTLPTSKETGRQPDSDFEIAVMNMLALHGYECEPQVGAAGFFIDLAVRDPNQPGRFLMGIECDGASYHSAKSARDRDRLRQSILEQLGWRIRRIWSVDWFRNAKVQLEPILRELESLKQSTSQEQLSIHPEEEEVASILEVVKEVDEQFGCAGDYGHGSLKTQLEEFDRIVIRKTHPSTAPGERLLRPAMIEALVEFRPTSKWEFLELIPGYLRSGTCPQEGKFLDEVFAIISGAGHSSASEEQGKAVLLSDMP